MYYEPLLKHELRWRRAPWPLLLATLIFFASGQSEIAGPPGIPFLDKMVHTGVFGLLATLVLRVDYRPGRVLRSVLTSVTLVSLYGIADEFRQSFTPGRSVEYADWIADTLGALVASLCYGYWTSWRRILEADVSGREKNEEMSALAAAGGDTSVVSE